MSKLSTKTSHALGTIISQLTDALAAGVAEAARVIAEGARVTAEGLRVIAEAARVSAEDARVIFTAQMKKAMSGDMVLVISPATVTKAADADGWTRTVTITLKDAAGNTHTWFNKTVAAACSVADTSSAGTVTIPNTSLVFSAGVATKVLTGDAAAFIESETDTLTVANLVVMGQTITGGTSVQTFTA